MKLDRQEHYNIAWKNPVNFGRDDRVNRGFYGSVMFEDSTGFAPKSNHNSVDVQPAERLRVCSDKFLKYGGIQNLVNDIQ